MQMRGATRKGRLCHRKLIWRPCVDGDGCAPLRPFYRRSGRCVLFASPQPFVGMAHTIEGEAYEAEVSTFNRRRMTYTRIGWTLNMRRLRTVRDFQEAFIRRVTVVEYDSDWPTG